MQGGRRVGPWPRCLGRRRACRGLRGRTRAATSTSSPRASLDRIRSRASTANLDVSWATVSIGRPVTAMEPSRSGAVASSEVDERLVSPAPRMWHTSSRVESRHDQPTRVMSASRIGCPCATRSRPQRARPSEEACTPMSKLSSAGALVLVAMLVLALRWHVDRDAEPCRRGRQRQPSSPGVAIEGVEWVLKQQSNGRQWPTFRRRPWRRCCSTRATPAARVAATSSRRPTRSPERSLTLRPAADHQGGLSGSDWRDRDGLLRQPRQGRVLHLGWNHPHAERRDGNSGAPSSLRLRRADVGRVVGRSRVTTTGRR